MSVEIDEKVKNMLMGKCEERDIRCMSLFYSETQATMAYIKVYVADDIEEVVKSIEYLRDSVKLLTLYLVTSAKDSDFPRNSFNVFKCSNNFIETLSKVKDRFSEIIPLLLLIIKGNLDRVPGVFIDLTYYVDMLTNHVTIPPLARKYELDRVPDDVNDLTHSIELLNNDIIELLSMKYHGKDSITIFVEDSKSKMEERLRHTADTTGTN